MKKSLKENFISCAVLIASWTIHSKASTISLWQKKCLVRSLSKKATLTLFTLPWLLEKVLWMKFSNEHQFENSFQKRQQLNTI